MCYEEMYNEVSLVIFVVAAVDSVMFGLAYIDVDERGLFFGGKRLMENRWQADQTGKQHENFSFSIRQSFGLQIKMVKTKKPMSRFMLSLTTHSLNVTPIE